MNRGEALHLLGFTQREIVKHGGGGYVQDRDLCIGKKNYRAGDIAPLAKWLSSMHRAQARSPGLQKPRVNCLLVVPALGR